MDYLLLTTTTTTTITFIRSWKNNLSKKEKKNIKRGIEEN